MIQDYIIANHRIRLEGKELIEATEALPGFSTFKAAENCDIPVARFIYSDTLQHSVETVHHSNEVDGIVSRFGTYGGGYAFDMSSPEYAPLSLWIPNNEGVACFSGNLSPRLFRFAFWIAYGVLTNPYKTIAIHTSTILYKDKAVLFLGESGTGKSTHTRLWRENIEGAVLLNDDSPIIRIIDGTPIAFGSPWSGKTPCYKNEHYPLAGCVRLSQAPYNKIDRLSIAQAYAALHPSCPPCFAYDDELYDNIAEVLSDLLASVPVYHLACLPNADAARLSCSTLFGNDICEK